MGLAVALGRKALVPVEALMTLTLQSRVFLRSSSNLRRTSCSGRGNGARNLGLRTILGESAFASLEL